MSEAKQIDTEVYLLHKSLHAVFYYTKALRIHTQCVIQFSVQ